MVYFKYSQGIEDELNWHGKPLGAKAEAAIAAITAQLKSSDPHTLKPSCPSQTLPDHDISNIKLSSNPEYSIGDKVSLKHDNKVERVYSMCFSISPATFIKLIFSFIKGK